MQAAYVRKHLLPGETKLRVQNGLANCISVILFIKFWQYFFGIFNFCNEEDVLDLKTSEV